MLQSRLLVLGQFWDNIRGVKKKHNMHIMYPYLSQTPNLKSFLDLSSTPCYASKTKPLF